MTLQGIARERKPLDWAEVQDNLGRALAAFGGRKGGTARLKEAVTAYRAALEEKTRERAPYPWAETQGRLGDALAALSERGGGTARLEKAVAAWQACLSVAASVRPQPWVQEVRSRIQQTEARIARGASVELAR